MTALPYPKPNKMTESEYLEFERNNEFKHKYLDGEVFAMVGANEVHNAIAMSTAFYLYAQLKDKPCEVYQSDMRVKVAELYTYPDIVVVCSEVKLEDDVFDTLLNPTVIMEVLSPSTEAYDRGEKFRYYRKLASLREYVLISQECPHIDHYVLEDDGMWQFNAVEGLDTHLELPSIDCTLTLNDVYRRVDFD